MNIEKDKKTYEAPALDFVSFEVEEITFFNMTSWLP